MPNSQLFNDSNSKYKLSSLLRDPNQNNGHGNNFWHNHHQKMIQLSGKGGMDHGHLSTFYSWNRKGRW